ncbi:hypothetical protein OH786_02685 [Streptomyces atratus]|uniref:Uncharacterized protein n=1 Tax=Streptomyces atratus TaxID=1893 RepID=A0A1K1ZGH8_STRAR|nr:hypothetical protein [Streptomyces atratus]SFX72796.1 hypothetical protein SAMN02787144_1005333 [Streptomyces atratus]
MPGRQQTVQALWCFTRQIQQMIEDGQDPSMPEQYGWRFLRAAYSRLTTARAQETAQHVLMREAIMHRPRDGPTHCARRGPVLE